MLMIDYSLLTEEDFSKMKLLNALIQKYGRELVLNQTLHFDPSEQDMIDMYKLANQIVFENKLYPEPKIQFKSISKGSKGTFGWQDKDKDGNIVLLKIPVIGYNKHSKDTFLIVVSTLMHELIHYKDLIDGPLSYIKDKEVRSEDEEQYVGEYNVHGSFFKKWIDIAYQNGIIVEQHHSQEGKRYIMADDNGVFIKDDGTVFEAQKTNNGNGQVNDSDPKIVKYAKRMFNHLKSDGLVGVEVKDGVASFMIE